MPPCHGGDRGFESPRARQRTARSPDLAVFLLLAPQSYDDVDKGARHMSERWKLPSFSQQPYRCRLYWAPRGAHQAAAAGDLLVVVDTLSFSSAVATAVQHGGIVYPCSPAEDVAALARRVGGVAAVGRRDVPARGRFSLSPLTFVDLVPGTRVVLASPNGGLCSH